MTEDDIDLKLYLEDRSLFWLFPDRWKDLQPHQLMNFDDGSWTPPPEILRRLDHPCHHCLKFVCSCSEPEPEPEPLLLATALVEEPQPCHSWLMRNALAFWFGSYSNYLYYSQHGETPNTAAYKRLGALINTSSVLPPSAEWIKERNLKLMPKYRKNPKQCPACRGGLSRSSYYDWVSCKEPGCSWEEAY